MADPHFPEPSGDTELQHLYNAVKRAFRSANLATPDLDARLLVTDTLGVTTAQLIANPRHRITEAAARELHRRTHERLAGRTLARILGKRAFWSLDLRLNEATLEPRPETETVVELALAQLPPDATATIADLGTGTGAILLAILSERPRAFGVGVDISRTCLQEAARNADRHNLTAQASFLCGNFGDALAQRFDLVVSNPPYIASAEIDRLDPAVRDNDPRLALDGGADGLTAYRAVFAQAKDILTARGALVVEIAPDALPNVLSEAASHALSPAAIAADLNGDKRAVALAPERS